MNQNKIADAYQTQQSIGQLIQLTEDELLESVRLYRKQAMEEIE